MKPKADSSKSSQYSFLSYPSAWFGTWNTLVTFLANYLNTSNNTYIYIHILNKPTRNGFLKVMMLFSTPKKDTLF